MYGISSLFNGEGGGAVVNAGDSLKVVNGGDSLNSKQRRSLLRRTQYRAKKTKLFISKCTLLRQNAISSRTESGETASICIPALTNTTNITVNDSLNVFYDDCKANHNFTNPYVVLKSFSEQSNVTGKVGSYGLFFNIDLSVSSVGIINLAP